MNLRKELLRRMKKWMWFKYMNDFHLKFAVFIQSLSSKFPIHTVSVSCFIALVSFISKKIILKVESEITKKWKS